MGRKNRSQQQHQELKHPRGSRTHHHDQDRFVGEIESTAEGVEVVEIIEIIEVPEHISKAGRHLADYPVVTNHETPGERDARRAATIDKQIDNIDLTPNEEDVQIDRYRATHLSAVVVGKPHEQIDDEITTKVSDFHTEKTPEGGVVINPLAHTKAGFAQGNQARHAAFKRRLGLPEDVAVISPVSGGQKK